MSQALRLKTVFQEKARDIKELLRKELKLKAQGVQAVKHKGLGGVAKGLEGTTNIAKAPFREWEYNIKDQSEEVLQPAEKLTSSVGGGKVTLRSFPKHMKKGYVNPNDMISYIQKAALSCRFPCKISSQFNENVDLKFLIERKSRTNS